MTADIPRGTPPPAAVEVFAKALHWNEHGRYQCIWEKCQWRDDFQADAGRLAPVFAPILAAGEFERGLAAAAEEHQYPSGLNAREAHEQFGCDCWSRGFAKAEQIYGIDERLGGTGLHNPGDSDE